jgi:large subunit ribosomal protein L13e
MEPKIYSKGKQRAARGFSYEELRQVNLDVKSARKLGLRVDMRRASGHEENVKLLKKRLEAKKKKKAPKKTAKSTKPKKPPTPKKE